MNQFTKEELQYLYDALWHLMQIGWTRTDLKYCSKIARLIEVTNDEQECKHEWVILFVIDEEKMTSLGRTSFKCLKCNKLSKQME